MSVAGLHWRTLNPRHSRGSLLTRYCPPIRLRVPCLTTSTVATSLTALDIIHQQQEKECSRRKYCFTCPLQSQQQMRSRQRRCRYGLSWSTQDIQGQQYCTFGRICRATCSEEGQQQQEVSTLHLLIKQHEHNPAWMSITHENLLFDMQESQSSP